MAESADLKTALERKLNAIKLRPSIGRGTATTTVKIRSGVTCDIEDGGWKLVADEGPGDGGAGLGPDPGVFGRAALGSCLAMGYVIWSTHLGVTFDSVEVVVEGDYDAVGMYGVDDSVPPGWGALRYKVKISSAAREERVREVVEFADRHSPLLDDFRRPVPITHELQITTPTRKWARRMEPKVHRRVQRYGWDKAVEDYDQFWVPRLRSCSERCLDLLDLLPGEHVLDLATGTGIAAFMAADLVGPAGEVIASDISERMVEAVRADAARRGVTHMRFERVDAEDIAFPDASFDAVICVLGLMYPADPQQAINQIHRILKPGGRAAVCVWGRRDRCGWNAVFPITDARVNSDVCPLFFSLGAPGALEFAFKQAGFTEMQEERVEPTLDFENAHAVCAAIFAGGPVALAYSRFTPELRDEVNSEFLGTVAPYRNGEAYDIPGEFVFMLAHK